jgi:hypothetical protein
MYIVLETMYDMNEYKICWFSRFVFPGEKSPCNVYIFHCIVFNSFTENMFAVKYCTRLKSTFEFREIIGFRGMPLCLWIWLGTMIRLVTVGYLWY